MPDHIPQNRAFTPSLRFSFELFPPKQSADHPAFFAQLDKLAALKPAFFSVTSGAGGTANQDNLTICGHIKNTLGFECVAHLCCINLSREMLDQKFAEFQAINIHSFLALRGDMPKNGVTDQTQLKDFPFAADLVEYIIGHYPSFRISVAGYPEGHNQNPSKAYDFDLQLRKAKLGADMVITQLFMDNALFFDYFAKMRRAGYYGRIIPGVFPLFSVGQITKIIELSGARMPSEVFDAKQTYANDPKGIREWGIDFAVRQIMGLYKQGHNHLHLYTMNRAEHISEILRRLAEQTQTPSADQ